MQVLSTGKTAREVTGTGEKSALALDLEAQLADARERLHRLENTNEELCRKLDDAEARIQRRRHKRQRPSALQGVTRRMPSPLGDLYVTVNEDGEGRPFEVFATLGKAGGAAMADVEAIGRLISLALRSGISLADIYKQMRGISCDRAVGVGPSKVLSVPDAIAQALIQHEREKEGVQQELLDVQHAVASPALPVSSGTATRPDPTAAQLAYDPGKTFLGTCPDCRSELQFREGCAKCRAGGYSEGG
jgi:ribonucleoside-diphosphate reductase alpha chain